MCHLLLDKCVEILVCCIHTIIYALTKKLGWEKLWNIFNLWAAFLSLFLLSALFLTAIYYSWLGWHGGSACSIATLQLQSPWFNHVVCGVSQVLPVWVSSSSSSFLWLIKFIMFSGLVKLPLCVWWLWIYRNGKWMTDFFRKLKQGIMSLDLASMD